MKFNVTQMALDRYPTRDANNVERWDRVMKLAMALVDGWGYLGKE